MAFEPAERVATNEVGAQGETSPSSSNTFQKLIGLFVQLAHFFDNLGRFAQGLFFLFVRVLYAKVQGFGIQIFYIKSPAVWA